MMFDKTASFRNIAAAVSSQEDSIAKI